MKSTPSLWRTVGLLVVATVVFVISTALLYLVRKRGLQDAANWAQLASVILALFALIPPVVGWWSRRPMTPRATTCTATQLRDAQERLSDLVRRQWDTEIAIRQYDEFEQLAVKWKQSGSCVSDQRKITTNSAVSSLRKDERASGFEINANNISGMAKWFRALPSHRQRLAILGEPGMGKTTVAVLLLRELLNLRDEGDPVPVLFTLSGWSPEESFADWLSRRLSESYQTLQATTYGPNAPRELVERNRRIIPIIDGLDEVPDQAFPKVVAALHERNQDPIIVTCRTAEYEIAVESSPRLSQLTSWIIMQAAPLKPTDVTAYLTVLKKPTGSTMPQFLAALKTDKTNLISKALATPLDI